MPPLYSNGRARATLNCPGASKVGSQDSHYTRNDRAAYESATWDLAMAAATAEASPKAATMEPAAAHRMAPRESAVEPTE